MELNEKLESLATKDDINAILTNFYAQIKSEIKAELQSEFEAELSLKDEKIAALESRIEKLERSDDCDVCDEIEADNWDTSDDGESKRKVDLLLIGDSIVRWVDPARIIPEGQVSEHICMPGKKTNDIKERLKEESSKSNFSKIVIHCASNNIPQDPPAKVALDVMSLAKTAKVNHPNAKIYVSAVLPKINSRYLPGINEVNWRLFKGQNNVGYHLIQHPQFCAEGQFDLSMFSKIEVENRRPVHLSRRGVINFAQNIKYKIKNM